MIRTTIRKLATEVAASTPPTTTPPTTTANTIKQLNISKPPSYTLAQLRTFPSLEPTKFLPLPTDFFATEQPARRDVLWSSVIYEADKARVGSNYVTLKSDSPYSNRKLRPQKGSGRARLGDANSPHMDNEVKAHAIKGPHDWSTELPTKIYAMGYQQALTAIYKSGGLNIIENEMDFEYASEAVSQTFVSSHRLNSLNLLFITDATRENLHDSIFNFYKNEKEFEKLDKREKPKYIRKLKGKVINKEDVEVRDILRAHRVFIELPALQWFIGKYGN